LEGEYPEHFVDFLVFLCEKYQIDRDQVFLEYSSKPPPSLMGDRPGFYEGLLSFRERNGRVEFLVTVFSVSRKPLLTLAHEFAHLVKNLKSGSWKTHLRPPDDAAESLFDEQALKDLAEFRSLLEG